MNDTTFPKYLNRINVRGGRPAEIVLRDEIDGVAVMAWTPSSMFGHLALKGEGWAASFFVSRDGSIQLSSGVTAGHEAVIFEAASEAFRAIHGGPAPLIEWTVLNGRKMEMEVIAAQAA